MTHHTIRLPFGRLILTVDVDLEGPDVWQTEITRYETKKGDLLTDVAIEGDDVAEVSRLAVEAARAERGRMETR